jgi:hypothetical protein
MKDYTQKIQLQAKKKQSSRQHNTKNEVHQHKDIAANNQQQRTRNV